MPGIDGLDDENSSKRLADLVYDRLSEAVVSGELAPGQRIRDGELAEKLGVSRMPVREALQRLAYQGLIEMVASRYTAVTEIPDGEPAASMEFLGYQAGVALRLAVPRLDDIDRRKVAGLVRAVGEGAKKSPQAAYDAAFDLLATVSNRSGNFLFDKMMHDTWLMLTRNLRGSAPLFGDPDDIAARFEEIAQAVEKDDSVRAEELMRGFFELGPGQDGPAKYLAASGD